MDKNWITSWRPSTGTEFIDWTFDLSDLGKGIQKFKVTHEKNYASVNTIGDSLKMIPNMLEINNGNFELIVDGKPFYMKEICYNTGHDWEEGFNPLSRKQLKKDFQLIKNMGANTIRRYEPSIFDRNILKEAKENNLKVMFGFWFDPKVDYSKDKDELRKYEKKVLSQIRKYKNDSSIIAWNIGNETWGLLKKHNAQPYLSHVRRSYLEFLDGLAKKIKEIDPNRPVFSSEEHDNERLVGAFYHYKAFAPNIDVLGINSYYEENISRLNEIIHTAYPGKPYAITEFGPKGYWNKELGDFRNDSLLIEVSSLEKAAWYKKQWIEHIELH